MEADADTNGSAAVSGAETPVAISRADTARGALDRFHMDDQDRCFLISVMSSDKTPKDEIQAVYDLAMSDRPQISTAENAELDKVSTKSSDDGRKYTPPVHDTDHMGSAEDRPSSFIHDIEIDGRGDDSTAHDLLYSFGVDDEVRDFLVSTITSGCVPNDDFKEIRDVSIMAGANDFDNRMACANSLRDQVLRGHYGEDVTMYLGIMRDCQDITEGLPDFRDNYWPVAAPGRHATRAVNGSVGRGAVGIVRPAEENANLVQKPLSQLNNGYQEDSLSSLPSACQLADSVSSHQLANDAGVSAKKTKCEKKTQTKSKSKNKRSMGQVQGQVPGTDTISEDDARFRVVCPIPRNSRDGSVCGKVCFDAKAYRSIQEHIRKAHPDRYIRGLSATEESFHRMVNNTPSSTSNSQPSSRLGRGPNQQIGPCESQVVRPADLSWPSANGTGPGFVVNRPAAKNAKLSRERSAQKSLFLSGLGQPSVGKQIPDSNGGPVAPALLAAPEYAATTFGQRCMQGDGMNEGAGMKAFGHGGIDQTISQSLFPQRSSGTACGWTSSSRKRKLDDLRVGSEETANQTMSLSFSSPCAGVYNSIGDPTLFFQNLPPQSTSAVSPEVLQEMVDILDQLREQASREESLSPEAEGLATAGQSKPPLCESTGWQVPLSQRNQTAAPKSPAKPESAQKHASSLFLASPSRNVEEDGVVEARPGSKESNRPVRHHHTGTVSALAVPGLDAAKFGLVQEEFSNKPFCLLVVITFLIRAPGKVALPAIRQVMERYPSPAELAAADPAEIEAMTHHLLGLSNQRTRTMQRYARLWLERPPSKHVRYGVKDYPQKGDGKDVRAGELFGAEDWELGGGGRSPDSSKENDAYAKTKARGLGTAWEIGHLTSGRYALDSWRIFCRDVLLGRAQDWKGKGRDGNFQPEWMRVLPEDKELRACLGWMWMREGWEWDPHSGEKSPLREEVRLAVDQGRAAYDDQGRPQIVTGNGEPAQA